MSEGKLTSASVELEGEVVAHIPDGVTEINAGALQSNLVVETINMPNTVISIENAKPWMSIYGAFQSCPRLKRINFSNNLISIGDNTFYNDQSLQTLNMPNALETVGNECFRNCDALSSVDFLNTQLATVGSEAFADCFRLVSVYLPSTVQSIGSDCFIHSHNLTDIYYTGTQEQWKSIQGLSDAGIPETCTIHYEYTPE